MLPFEISKIASNLYSFMVDHGTSSSRIADVGRPADLAVWVKKNLEEGKDARKRM